MPATEKSTMLRAQADQMNQDRLEEQGREIDLTELFYRLLDKWVWILLTAVVAAVLAGVVTFFFMQETYTSTTKLYVLNSSDSAIDLSSLSIGEKLADDYVEVFKNWHVYEKVVEGLKAGGIDIPYTYKELQKMMKIAVVGNTRIISISITSTNPVEAQQIALAYALAAKSFIANTMKTDEPTLFEEPRVPVLPDGPSMVKNVLLAFVAGAMFMAIIIIVQYLVDDRVRSAEQLEKYLGLATLGLMPVQENGRKNTERRVRKGGAA